MKRINVFFLLFFAASLFLSCNEHPGETKASSMLPLKDERIHQDFKIFNDPGSRKITIQFNSGKPGKGVVSIFYTDGKLSGRKQVIVNKGMNTWEYEFPDGVYGIFMVRFTMEDLERTGKVFKRNK